MTTHVYTSITSNYLPKARVLAHSIKGLDPAIRFHLVLCDNPPVGFVIEQEPFDELIVIETLITRDFPQWTFGHSVVELCTAVKGAALEYILTEHDAGQVFYFDPDMVVFGRLDELQDTLSRHSLVLTPHLSDPEINDMGIMDNEVSSLLHGVYNLGFLGVRNCPEGLRFASWWARRLAQYCHDDLPRGLFTDQKWVDLAPCFFDDVGILRSPAFNVATWNITNRKATGTLDTGILINGEELGFYHFSGFDSGDQATMLARYGKESPVLYELRDWYIGECERYGQSALGTLRSKFDTFADGQTITRGYRLLYRQRLDLQQAFPNPYLVDGSQCYKAWYDAHPLEQPPGDVVRIAPGIPLSVVFSELARHFRLMLNAGRGGGRIGRLLLRGWGALLHMASRAAAWRRVP